MSRFSHPVSLQGAAGEPGESCHLAHYQVEGEKIRRIRYPILFLTHGRKGESEE